MAKISIYIVPSETDPTKYLFSFTAPDPADELKKHGTINLEEGTPVGPTAMSITNGASVLAMAQGSMYATPEVEIPDAALQALLGG